jgi:hypothetical protein
MPRKRNDVCPVCKDKYEVHEDLAACFEEYTELEAPQNDLAASALLGTYCNVKTFKQDQRQFAITLEGEKHPILTLSLPHTTMWLIMNNKLASEEKEPDPEPEPEEPNEE